ncbi:hypothetical protein [Halosolutus halophilus]|uniref:hypothetical protein n=1 Tax=Halosolutus halophilus TaxID=1552990 RepID=UPI002234FC24|nr:hypothetical protein [Halosolutus halophilus]
MGRDHAPHSAGRRDDDDVSIDETARRRRVLEYLDSGSGIATLEELVDALPTGTTDRRRRIHLHHEVVPRLEENGYLFYESTSQYVVRTD